MDSPANTMRIQVCYATPSMQILHDLSVSPGITLLDAIHLSGILQQVPEIDLAVSKTGIYGKLKPLDTVLREHDRVEIYRPLTADPKEARRRRVIKKKKPAKEQA